MATSRPTAEDREAETLDDERSPEADGVETGGGAEVGERERQDLPVQQGSPGAVAAGILDARLAPAGSPGRASCARPR
jgi:hypothetical protein